ncbi:MAG: TolC family protein [Bacteroidales bacterium]
MKKKVIILLILLPAVSRLNSQEGQSWSLEKCIDYAIRQNIQVRKTELTNERNNLYYDQAKAQRFPSVSASAGQNFNWQRNTSTGQQGFFSSNSSSYSVNSGVTIYGGSRLTNQISQARLDIEGGEYSLETTKENISLSILNAFLQVLYSKEQVRNSQKQIASTEEQLRLAGERLELKVISVADYAQVKSELASEKLTLANAESQLSISKINLMQLMELPVDNGFDIVQPSLAELLNQNRVPDVKAVYETALAIKPQIKNAEINKQLAQLDEKIARAGYYPTLSASGGISTGYSSVSSGAYGNQLSEGVRPAAGLSLSIPIYQRKQVKTSVEVAKIGVRDAELSELDTRNQLRKSIEQACLDVTSAQAEFVASNEKYNATLEASKLSDEKFGQGLINSVDYLVSKTNLIVAESQLLQSKYNLIFSYKVLDFYTGVPLAL